MISILSFQLRVSGNIYVQFTIICITIYVIFFLKRVVIFILVYFSRFSVKKRFIYRLLTLFLLQLSLLSPLLVSLITHENYNNYYGLQQVNFYKVPFIFLKFTSITSCHNFFFFLSSSLFFFTSFTLFGFLCRGLSLVSASTQLGKNP